MPPRGRPPPRGNEGPSSRGSGSDASNAAMLCFCVAAIYSMYVTQGVLQEKISTSKYGADQQRFQHLTFLNLSQCLVCFLWSFTMLKIWPGEPDSTAPIMAYWPCSISNAIGPACGMLALKYISYPAQVLAKSSKMIPVMLMGAIVYKVPHTMQEYFYTLMVAGGVALFAMKGSGALDRVASPNAPLGYALCLLNLALDGFTNATQDSLTARYPKVNEWHLMMGMNLWGTAYMAAFMFLFPGGGGYDAIRFCANNPEAARDIMLFCLCGTVGQNFIFRTISHFGALTTTTITTTRKFVSILVSSVWHRNPLSPQQWLGVVLVFLGLSYQIACKYQKRAAASGAYVESHQNAVVRLADPRAPPPARSRGPTKRRMQH